MSKALDFLENLSNSGLLLLAAGIAFMLGGHYVVGMLFFGFMLINRMLIVLQNIDENLSVLFEKLGDRDEYHE